MVGHEWSQLLAFAGLALAALLIALGVVRARHILTISGFALLVTTIGTWSGVVQTRWASDVLARLIIASAFLMIIVLTRR
jgi:hypothetical protein